MWMVQDLESTNGTVIKGTRLERHQLSDGDVIGLGDAKVLFAEASGQFRALLDGLVVDKESGLLNLKACESDVGRMMRRNAPPSLCAFDIDNFSLFIRRAGPLQAREALEKATDCLAEKFGRDRVYRIDEDAFLTVIPNADPLTPHLSAAHDALQKALAPHELRTSGALVRGKTLASSSAADALGMLEEKLLQAKLAGGDCLLTSSVTPTWCRGATEVFEQWLERNDDASCLVVSPSRRSAFQAPAAAQEVRSWIAARIEVLPEDTEVAVVWTSDLRFLVGATCREDDLRSALTSPDLVVLERRDVRKGWLRRFFATGKRRQRPEMSHAFAQLCAPLHAASEVQLWTSTVVAYEKALQLSANLLLAAYAAHLHSVVDREVEEPDLTKSQVATLRLIDQRALDKGQGATGLGRWPKLISELALQLDEHLDAPSLSFLDSKWLGRTHHARTTRNSIHEHSSPDEQKRASKELYDRILELAEIFCQEEWELLHIDRVERVRYRRGWARITYRRLGEVLMSEHPSEETDQHVEVGTWCRLGARWILTSPLVEFDYCESTARQVVFVAAGIPATTTHVERVAVGQRSQSTASVSHDHIELRTLIELLARVRADSLGSTTMIIKLKDLRVNAD